MPKERILPYVILGLVHQHKKLSGRDISHQFKNEIGNFWRSSHSQVYPELKRMLEEEWLVQHRVPHNDKEKYYTMTEAGEAELAQWLQAPILEAPVQKDMFSLKMFFIKDREDPRLWTMLQEERQLLEDNLTRLKAREAFLFSKEEDIQENFGHYLILTRAIDRVSGQLAWITDCIQRLQ